MGRERERERERERWRWSSAMTGRQKGERLGVFDPGGIHRLRERSWWRSNLNLRRARTRSGLRPAQGCTRFNRARRVPEPGQNHSSLGCQMGSCWALCSRGDGPGTGLSVYPLTISKTMTPHSESADQKVFVDPFFVGYLWSLCGLVQWICSEPESIQRQALFGTGSRQNEVLLKHEG